MGRGLNLCSQPPCDVEGGLGEQTVTSDKVQGTV